MELEPSSYEEALDLLRQYPFFAYEALKALDLAPDAEAKARMKALLAVNVGEISDLREILGLNSDSLADFYPDSVPPQLSTDATISAFLDRFGGQTAAAISPETVSPAPDEPDSSSTSLDQTEAIPLPIVPQTDYISMLAAEPSAEETEAPRTPEADDTLSAIDAFLAEVPPAQPRPKTQAKPAPVSEHNESDSTALSESFAKILIKNRNYSKALEIIEELNLKNPEKSIYFADQIRFLKKLIINQSKS